MFHFQKSIGACLAEIIIGILLLIDPEGFTGVICTLLGAGLLAKGAWNIIRYFRSPANEASRQMNLSTGIVVGVFGVFLILNNDFLLNLFPALTMLYGILMLILAIEKVQWTVDLYRLGSDRWFIAAIDAALTAVLGLIVTLNPFTTTAFLWTFTAVSMTVSAVFDISAIVLYHRALR